MSRDGELTVYYDLKSGEMFNDMNSTINLFYHESLHKKAFDHGDKDGGADPFEHFAIYEAQTKHSTFKNGPDGLRLYLSRVARGYLEDQQQDVEDALRDSNYDWNDSSVKYLYNKFEKNRKYYNTQPYSSTYGYRSTVRNTKDDWEKWIHFDSNGEKGKQ